METPLVVFFLVIGLPLAIWPYKLSKFSEQLDAIGSKRSSSEVEPADWKVALNRVLGGLLTAVGVLGLVLG